MSNDNEKNLDETLNESIRVRSELIKAELTKIETAVNWATTDKHTWGTAGDLGYILKELQNITHFLGSR